MEMNKLYDSSSLKQFKDSARVFKDSNNLYGNVLARNTEYIDPTVFKTRFNALSFVNSGIVVDNSGGVADVIRSLKQTYSGEFKEAGDLSTEKGQITMSMEDSYITVKEFEAGAKWTDTDIKKYKQENRNIVQEYFQIKREIYMRNIDSWGLVGYKNHKGLLNHSGFAISSATGTAETLSAEEIYQEFEELINAQRAGANGASEYECNKVVMPKRVMRRIQSKIMNSNASTKNVLRALQDNYPDIKFLASDKAEDVEGLSRTVAYTNFSEGMKFRIPQKYTVGNIIQISSFKFEVEAKYRIAGLDVLENASARILTGL